MTPLADFLNRLAHRLDLPGVQFDIAEHHPDLWPSRHVAVLATFRGQCARWSAHVVVPLDAIEDSAPMRALMAEVCAQQIERWLKPWLTPDRNPFPVLRFWPLLDRIEERYSKWAATWKSRTGTGC